MGTPNLPNTSTVTVTTGGLKSDVALKDAVLVGNGVRSEASALAAAGIAPANYGIIKNIVALTPLAYAALGGSVDPDTLYVIRDPS
jgi:hypothetical protein